MSIYGDWREGAMTDDQLRHAMMREMAEPDYCGECEERDCEECPLERRD